MQTDTNQINDIREAEEDGRIELNSWESDFMDSIEATNEYTDLSKRQRVTLDKIHDKIRPW